VQKTSLMQSHIDTRRAPRLLPAAWDCVVFYSSQTRSTHYRARLGRRLEPPDDVREFMAQLEAYNCDELAGALQSKWLARALNPYPNSNPQ
jgi:hypothetical protein